MRNRALLTLTLLALLAGCGGDGSSSPTPSASATAIATASAAPPTPTSRIPVGGELTWERGDPAGALAGPGLQVVRAIVEGGPGLVAVGSEDSGGDANAAVWVSTDGYTWTQVPHDAAAMGGVGIQMMNAVATGGPGLVAVGIDDPEGSAEAGFVDTDAAAWVSDDGLAWTRIPHDESVLGGPSGQRMMAITVGGPGLVAVGSDYRDGSTWPDGAVWVSADGYRWSRTDDPAVFGGPGGQEILSVTAGGPGVVAVGSAESYADAAAWVSEDAYSWSRVANDTAVFGGGAEMRSVIAAGRGLVAAGGSTGGSDHVMVWQSADGYTWIRNEDDTLAPEGLAMQAAAPWDGGLAVAGTNAAGDHATVEFWLSTDGQEWDGSSPDPEVFGSTDGLAIDALTGWREGLVVLAGDVSTSDWNGVVWVGTPAG